jgi:hypothetical protein
VKHYLEANKSLLEGTAFMVKRNSKITKEQSLNLDKSKETDKEQDNGAQCNHTEWNMVGYNSEINSKFCSTGYYLWNIKCAVCNASFVKDGKSIKNDTFRASANTPIFFCRAMQQNKCNHAVCNDCYKKELIGTNQERSSRTARK